MKLNIRELREDDWETLVSFWKAWPEWKYYPSKDMLPMNGLGGLMVCKGDQPVMAGFLYLTNSKVAWIEWIVSNPEYRDEDREDAKALLISSLEQVARSQGCYFILSVGRNKGLIKTHEDLGFTVDKNPSYEISKKIV